MDDEHRELFSQINRLGETLEAKQWDEFATVLECFAGYLRAHFRREEKLMVVTRCPAMERNLREHREMERRLLSWNDKIELCGLAPELGGQVFAELREWMPRHIEEVDLQLRAAGRAARRPVPVQVH